MTRIERLDGGRWTLRWAATLKTALLLASAAAAVVPAEQLEGKGMAWRLPIVVAAASVVPLAWRGRFAPHPATADWLVMAR